MLRKRHILAILVIIASFVTAPAFAQEMVVYENELYEFYFEIPMNWKYLEDVQTPKGDILHVILYPEEFNILVNNDTPLIGVFLENIPESKVPSLNAQSLEEWVLDEVRTEIPDISIVNSSSVSTSWGWIVTLDYRLIQKNLELYGQDHVFVFKDRESYDVGYVAIEEDYFDSYKPVYDHVLDTMVIKGVVVPEFQEIALMVLGSSIVLIIVFARKFSKLQLTKNS